MSVTPLSTPETKAPSQPQQGTQYVFFFGAGKAEGNGKMKDELGGKGAGLAEMTNAALPVPPGFTIQTAGCREFMKTAKVSDGLERQMKDALARLEELQKQSAELTAAGHEFQSDTDTEAVPHLIEELYRGDLVSAVRQALRRGSGIVDGAVASKVQRDELADQQL